MCVCVRALVCVNARVVKLYCTWVYVYIHACVRVCVYESLGVYYCRSFKGYSLLDSSDSYVPDHNCQLIFSNYKYLLWPLLLVSDPVRSLYRLTSHIIITFSLSVLSQHGSQTDWL